MVQSASLLAKRGSVCAFALLLVLLPVCSGWCQAQSCGAQRASSNDVPCHETGHEAASSLKTVNLSIASPPGCPLREFPATLSTKSTEVASQRETTNFTAFAAPSLGAGDVNGFALECQRSMNRTRLSASDPPGAFAGSSSAILRV